MESRRRLRSTKSRQEPCLTRNHEVSKSRDIVWCHSAVQACQLKRSVIGRFVPVIGVGGNASGSHRRAFAAGIDQWLAKPATREETLLEVLSALRARQNYRLLLERD